MSIITGTPASSAADTIGSRFAKQASFENLQTELRELYRDRRVQRGRRRDRPDRREVRVARLARVRGGRHVLPEVIEHRRDPSAIELVRHAHRVVERLAGDEPRGDGAPGPRRCRHVPEPRMAGQPEDRARGTHQSSARASMPPRRTSTNSLIRMARRSGVRWIKPGSRSSDDERVLEPLGDPIEHRRQHLHVDVAADLAARHPELNELERAVGVLAPHEAVDRPPQAEAGVVAPDHRDAVRDPVLLPRAPRYVRSTSRAWTRTQFEDVGRRVEPGGKHRHRALIGRQEEPLLVREVEEDGSLGDAHLVRDVLDASAAVAVFGELAHRGLDDPLPSRLRVGGALRASIRSDGRCHGIGDSSGKEEPEGPPARREPKPPATVSPSGSVAPSNLRDFAWTRTPRNRLATIPAARRRACLAACPAPVPLRDSPCGSPGRGADPVLRPSRPARSWPCGFPEPGAPDPPCGLSGAPSGSSLRHFDCLERGEI